MKTYNSKKGAISIELALMLVCIFIPMIVGSIDFIFIMMSRGNVLSGIISLEKLATSYPNLSTNQDVINKFIKLQNPGLYQYSPATLSFSCLQQDGSEKVAEITYTNGNDLSSLSTALASSNITNTPSKTTYAQIGTNNIGTVSCTTGYLQTFVTYYIADKVSLPVGMPFFGNQFIYKAYGTIWVH